MKKHTLTLESMKRIYLLKFPERQREQAEKDFEEMMQAHANISIGQLLHFHTAQDNEQSQLVSWFLEKVTEDDTTVPGTPVDANKTMQHALRAILEGHGYPVGLLGLILPILKDWEQSQEKEVQ